jgi:hypothetical protein
MFTNVLLLCLQREFEGRTNPVATKESPTPRARGAMFDVSSWMRLPMGSCRPNSEFFQMSEKPVQCRHGINFRTAPNIQAAPLDP